MTTPLTIKSVILSEAKDLEANRQQIRFRILRFAQNDTLAWGSLRSQVPRRLSAALNDAVSRTVRFQILHFVQDDAFMWGFASRSLDSLSFARDDMQRGSLRS